MVVNELTAERLGVPPLGEFQVRLLTDALRREELEGFGIGYVELLSGHDPIRLSRKKGDIMGLRSLGLVTAVEFSPAEGDSLWAEFGLTDEGRRVASALAGLGSAAPILRWAMASVPKSVSQLARDVALLVVGAVIAVVVERLIGA